jgi:DNA-binding beta-propeller fold protein YncE
MFAGNLLKLFNLGGLIILLSLLLAACSTPATTPEPTPEVPVAEPRPTPEPTQLYPLAEPTPNVPNTPTSTPEPTDTAPSTPPTPTPELSGLITDIQIPGGRTYEKGILAAGETVHIDRDYSFTHVPAVLEGQEFIRSANDDKEVAADDFLTFTLSQDAIVYVLYDMRSITLPEWLADDSWELIDQFVVTDDVIRRVYKREFPAGQVTLGGNAQPPMAGSGTNYNVVVRPADDLPPEETLTTDDLINIGVEFAVNHVVYNQEMLDQYMDEGQLVGYVQPQDSFMLLSGNNSGEIDTDLLNSWAATLREQYPASNLYAATSGINNVRMGAIGLDNDLFAGLMMVYEPNQDNAPEFTWEMSETKLIWKEAADIIGSNGLEPWGKPSGRSLPGTFTRYFGNWDYGVLAAVMSGVNVQTQGSCRKGELNRALPYLIQQFRGVQANSDLFVQVTVASDQINYSEPEDAIFCAQTGWSYPEVDGVTMWWSPSSVDEVERFLELRKEQFLSEEVQNSPVDPAPEMTPVPSPTPTPEPEPTPPPTAAPDPTAAPVSAPVGGSGPGQFTEPRGIAIDTQSSKVFVADTGNHRIQVFNQTGLFLFEWGSQGSGPGQFEEPSAIAIDSTNSKVYVADTGNHRIQVFNQTGLFLFEWGSQGNGPGQFKEPSGIAINSNSGKVYVADTGNDRVQVFSGSGMLFFVWGERGNDEAQFKSPSDIAFDPDTNKLYVLDSRNHRIQVLYENGIFDDRWGRRGDTSGRLRNPSNIEFHPLNNYLYVTDTGNQRVQVFDIAGGVVFEWRIPSGGEAQFSEITGIAANPDNGQIYVVDAGNHRVQVFSQGGTYSLSWGNQQEQ